MHSFLRILISFNVRIVRKRVAITGQFGRSFVYILKKAHFVVFENFIRLQKPASLVLGPFIWYQKIANSLFYLGTCVQIQKIISMRYILRKKRQISVGKSHIKAKTTQTSQ